MMERIFVVLRQKMWEIWLRNKKNYTDQEIEELIVENPTPYKDWAEMEKAERKERKS